MLDQTRSKSDAGDRPSEARAVVEAVADAGSSANDLAIAHALAPTASARERINALLSIGLSVDELAQTIGVAENTIRNWSDGSVEPRRAADRALDDLRTVVLALKEHGVESDRAVNWLRSRNREWLENARPLDLVRSDPLLLFAAAEDEGRVEEVTPRKRRREATRTGESRAQLTPAATSQP